MKNLLILICSLFVVTSINAQTDNQQVQNNRTNIQDSAMMKAPRIQMVFCLDATGSMSGLIATAKQKIWSIASSLLQNDPKPEVWVGLVFYRDRGDAFITKLVDVSQDMDSVYSKLMDIQAAGGGDSPESVNQALNDAVRKFQWDTDTSTYKTIFLVGDCPPHMNYHDDVKYPVTCELAVKKGIVINAIQMGNCQGAEVVWASVARLTGGEHIRVNQGANGYVVTTPYDAEIARLQNVIDNSTLYYGTKSVRTVAENKKTNANNIYKKGKTFENASRAEYKYTKGKTKDVYYRHDLITEVESGKMKLDTLSAANLPDTMLAMSLEQRKQYVKTVIANRDSAQAELNVQIQKRNEFIKAKTEAESTVSGSSFSNKVYDSMKSQSAKKGVVLKGKVKE